MLAHFDWWLLIMFLLVCAMALFNLYSASYPPKTWGIPPYLKQLYRRNRRLYRRLNESRHTGKTV